MDSKLSVPQFPLPNSVQRIGDVRQQGRGKVSLQPGHSLMDWIRLTNSSVDLTGTGRKFLHITPEELAKHKSRDDAWICLKGKIYNVTRYLSYHPGGEDELLRGVGIDATDLFNQVHRWVNIESMLKGCLVGKLISSLKKSSKGGISSSNFLAPSSPNQNNQGPSQPKLDWFQTDDSISVVIYTQCKTIKQNSVITSVTVPEDCDETSIPSFTFYCAVYISSPLLPSDYHIYTLNIELEREVEPLHNVKLSSASGTIEIMLKKKGHCKSWSGLGKPLANHKTFIKATNRDVQYRKCSLVKKEFVTHDTDLYALQLPVGCRMNVPIGCHVHLHAKRDGVEIDRSYTCVLTDITTPDDMDANYNHVNLMIKCYNDGVLTPVINNLSIGDTVSVSDYDGNFDCGHLDCCTHLYLVAAGTGLTPMIRMINYCLFSASSNCRLVKLLFFNKTESDIIWHDQLTSLQDEFTDRFELEHVLSRAGPNWSGTRGHVSKRLLQDMLGVKVKSNAGEIVKDLICICGPKEFTKSTLQFLKELDYSAEQIHTFDG